MNKVDHVFKTSVQTYEEVSLLKPHINMFLGHSNWNFDLGDCDRVFRVEGAVETIPSLVAFFHAFGVACEELV